MKVCGRQLLQQEDDFEEDLSNNYSTGFEKDLSNNCSTIGRRSMK